MEKLLCRQLVGGARGWGERGNWHFSHHLDVKPVATAAFTQKRALKNFGTQHSERRAVRTPGPKKPGLTAAHLPMHSRLPCKAPSRVEESQFNSPPPHCPLLWEDITRACQPPPPTISSSGRTSRGPAGLSLHFYLLLPSGCLERKHLALPTPPPCP